MSHALLLLAGAACAGAATGFLRGSVAHPTPLPAPLPTPPLREMVVIPYESPEALTQKLHQLALAKEIESYANQSIQLTDDLANPIRWIAPPQHPFRLSLSAPPPLTNRTQHQLV